MAQWRHIIRPAPGGDGPFTCTTESRPASPAPDQGWAITNITTGIQTVGAALDQAKSDGASLLGSLTLQQITISSTAY